MDDTKQETDTWAKFVDDLDEMHARLKKLKANGHRQAKNKIIQSLVVAVENADKIAQDSR